MCQSHLQERKTLKDTDIDIIKEMSRPPSALQGVFDRTSSGGVHCMHIKRLKQE